jgi:hypothetical protein
MMTMVDTTEQPDRRIAQSIEGHQEVADYFGTDPMDAATTMAWHAGYEAGATEQAAHSSGYAQAERDIMEWLRSSPIYGVHLGCRQRIADEMGGAFHRDQSLRLTPPRKQKE